MINEKGRRTSTAPYSLERSELNHQGEIHQGCPPKEAVVGSPVTLPKFCGLRKSTVVSGVLKLYVLKTFCISQRN